MPFGYKTASYLEYDSVTKYYSDGEARALAEAEMQRKLEYELDGAEILEISVKERKTESSLILTYEIVAIENIAIAKEFEINYKK